MDSKMKLRIAAMPIALVAIASPMMVTGCDEISEAQSGLCCSDFTAGADLSGVDFEADAAFAGFIQASADFAGAANAMVTDVANACMAMAIDNGAAEGDVTATDPAERANQWCAKATAQIQAQITAFGELTISVQPAECSFSASAQASCEGKCEVNAECSAELGNVEARCDPGQLSGKCEGKCTAKCEGSANLAVSCEGSCEGTCEGTCDGMANPDGASGRCAGTCEGKCRGTCTASAMAEGTCEGDCTGGCDVQIKAPKCKAELTPPSAECSGNADCSGSCKASASAKAECKPPSVEVAFSGAVSGDADAAARFLASLKLHLPNIFLAAKVRGELLVANAQAVVELGAKLDPGSLSVKAAACLIPAANAIGEAAVNAEASVSASVSVVGAVGG